MPTTSEPLTPTTPHSLDPSLSASTSYLAQEPLKLCSTCLQPLLGSGLDSEPDPFLLSLGDDPSASAIVDGSAPMMCGRCARSREDERRVGIRDELGTVGELGMGLGEQDRVGAVSALGGGDPQQTSQDINERAHGPAREGVLSSDSESEGTTAAVEAEGARAGRVDLTRDGSLLVPPPAGSSGLALRRQPSIDAVVQSAIVNAPAPPSTRSSSRSSLAPPPSSAAARPTTPLSPTPTRQTAPLPHPPTPSTSTYVLPPRRDPVLDLTKRRVPSVGKDCIYPGSKFIGTQKSGRNSYDVSIEIVDVDFPQSTLSGYLTIEGLTEDHPVLTTFFEGEIIGPHHGFLTNRWGASETADLSHWQRFSLFRPLKSIVRRTPGWTLPSPYVASPPPLMLGLGGLSGVGRSYSADKNQYSPPLFGGGASSASATGNGGGGCFFRFKEKFIISDHRLTSVSGASFSGFYYICVEFSSPLTPPPSIASTPAASTPASSVPPSAVVSRATSPRPPGTRPGTPSRLRSVSTGTIVPSTPARRMSAGKQQTVGPLFEESSGGKMLGFYYHQTNTEPFQELSLRHVKEKVRPTFEFR